MKRVLILLAVIILIIGGVSTANAEPVDTTVYAQYIPTKNTYKEYPIWPQTIKAWKDEGILIAGRTTEETEKHSTGAIMLLDVSGKLVWHHEENGIEDNTVYEVSQRLNDETIVSLLKGDQTDYIEWIYKDGTLKRSNLETLSSDIRDIFVNDQGVLAIWNEDIAPETHCIQIDENGNQLWNLNFEDYLIFHDMLQEDGVIYLLGTVSGMGIEDHTYQGIIVAIDEDGQLMWKQKCMSYERFTDGCLMTNGKILLAGIRSDFSRSSGVCCMSEEGIHWDTVLPKPSAVVEDINLKIDLIDAIIAYENDDYLIACEGTCLNGSGAWLFRVSSGGYIKDTKYVFNDLIYAGEGCELLNLQGDIYLLCYGMVAQGHQEKMWDEKGIPDYGDPIRGFYMAKIDF